MKLLFAVFALLVFAFIFAHALPARADDTCTEGDRRICGTDTGICQNGRSVCIAGNWTECNGEIRPQIVEVCGNGLDDNCDGKVDEDCFPWMSLILVGIGIFFIGLGIYYMQKNKGERLTREGVSKD